jgi:hypothetical protein
MFHNESLAIHEAVPRSRGNKSPNEVTGWSGRGEGQYRRTGYQ